MKQVTALLLSAAALVAAGCGPKEDTAGAVAGVTLSERSLVLYTGEQATLSAEVYPATAVNKAVRWESRNPAVATVDKGVVSAHAEGTTTISVTTEDGGFTDAALVSVLASVVPVQGVTLSEREITIVVGNPYSGLFATLTPADATNRNLVWTVSDTDLLTLREDGDGHVTLTGHFEADGFVTVATEDGDFKAICTVYVRDVHAESIAIEGGDFVLDTYATRQLRAVVSPEGAVNTSVTWSTSDASVATVSESGLVTGLKAGTAVIKATAVDGGFSDTVTVTVRDVRVTGVRIAQGATAGVTRDNTLQLTAVITPENATNKAVTWTSSVPSVASVTADGLVKGLSRGSTTITVTTVDGGFQGQILITVTVPSTDIGTGGDFGESDYGEYN